MPSPFKFLLGLSSVLPIWYIQSPLISEHPSFLQVSHKPVTSHLIWSSSSISLSRLSSVQKVLALCVQMFKMVVLSLLPYAEQLPFWFHCTALYGDIISEAVQLPLFAPSGLELFGRFFPCSFFLASFQRTTDMLARQIVG